MSGATFVWTCTKGDECTNKERPGFHEDYFDVRECMTGEPKPEPSTSFGIEEKFRRLEQSQ